MLPSPRPHQLTCHGVMSPAFSWRSGFPGRRFLGMSRDWAALSQARKRAQCPERKRTRTCAVALRWLAWRQGTDGFVQFENWHAVCTPTLVSIPDLTIRPKQKIMLRSKMHLLVGVALLAATAFPITAAFARPSAPIVAVQAGGSSGTLHGPSTSSIGRIHGRLSVASGAVYECVGTLEPNNDSGGIWTGYSPTGTIEGILTPLTGSAHNGLRFWGSYGIDEDGDGKFHAFLTAPGTVAGDARYFMGSFSGRFTGASEISPHTLLPIPGKFHGAWDLR